MTPLSSLTRITRWAPNTHDSTRRKRWWCDKLYNSDGDPMHGDNKPAPLEEPKDGDYNLVSSLLNNGLHSPAIDIDIPMEVIPSSTPGHHHVYFPGVELPYEEYMALLLALRNAGIISYGYFEHSRRRGQTLLRPPHVKKER